MVTADIRGPENCSKTRRVIKNKSCGVESDFFFQPKTPQKADNLRGAGLVNLFKHRVLCSFSVGNNLPAYSEAWFTGSGTHTPHEGL